MPQVGTKRYPYTPEGEKQASLAKSKQVQSPSTKQPNKIVSVLANRRKPKNNPAADLSRSEEVERRSENALNPDLLQQLQQPTSHIVPGDFSTTSPRLQQLGDNLFDIEARIAKGFGTPQPDDDVTFRAADQLQKELGMYTDEGGVAPPNVGPELMNQIIRMIMDKGSPGGSFTSWGLEENLPISGASR